MRSRRALWVGGILVVLLSAGLALGQAGSLHEGGEGEGGLLIEAPTLALTGVPFEVTVRPAAAWPDAREVVLEVRGEGAPRAQRATLRDEGGELRAAVSFEGLRVSSSGAHRLVARVPGHARASAPVRVIPGWLAILPPLLAIALAIALKDVVIALVAGVWLGATFVHDGDPFLGLLRTADTYVVGAIADGDHASIVVFSLLLGGMIGVVAKSGGSLGLAQLVTRFAKDRRSGALTTWAMGLVIFFDDYSNALLVGTTMRPITDKLRISREKLSWLVDATSAPVSSFAVISSWVGVEIGYIADQYAALGLEGDPYVIFLETIPYRFYPILVLWLGLVLILLRRDFGPMWRAEARAITTGELSGAGARPASDFDAKELSPDEGRGASWVEAVVPIVVVVATALIGMVTTGQAALEEARVEASAALEAAQDALGAAGPADRAEATADVASAERALSLLEPSLRNVFGKASSLKALLWAALLGGLTAIILAVTRRTLHLREAMGAWVAGIRSILLAVMILVLAWSLGEICAQLHTAQLVIQAIGPWLSPSLLPAAVFLIAAGVSFATGTSWGTMGILFPLVVPLAHQLAPTDPALVLGAIGAILSGSVWGDHCSPVSDTTIMSSMASSCDHVDHVRTQLPYAVLAGGVSVVVGELGTGLGLYGAPVALVVGALTLALVARFVGKPLPEAPTSESA